jgi:hypothetical protein
MLEVDVPSEAEAAAAALSRKGAKEQVKKPASLSSI